MLYCVRAKWKNIGIQLEVDLGTLNAIDKRHRSDPDDCLPEMLDYWLKQVNPPPSWNSLAEALESEPIGEGHLAEQIREKYCSELTLEGCAAATSILHSDSRPPLSQCVTGSETDRHKSTATRRPRSSWFALNFLKFKKPKERDSEYLVYLKALYTGNTRVSYNKWPYACTPITEYYVNLYCVDGRATMKYKVGETSTEHIVNERILNFDKFFGTVINKSCLTIEQVACSVKDGASYPNVVLVIGAPGVGKTTFSWELCHRWAKGELLKDYSLVILLNLRDEGAREAKDLIDLFPYPKRSTSEAAAVMDEVLKINGKGVLFLLEGFDELPEAMRSKPSIYLDLINGKLFPFATVLVTSRPWAVGDLQWKYPVRRIIEIVGFTGQQIDEYVVRYSNGDHKLLTELRRYLSLNPPIHAAMYIPLNAVIVCELYKERRSSGRVIPSTMTELYTIFSRNLLLRYLDEGPQDPVRQLIKFEDLPPKIYQKFLALCELAYKGIVNKQQLVFSDLPDDFDSLGFMKSVQELHISSGVSVSYNFLHLTMQEFLAAYHLSLHPECTQHLSAVGSAMVIKFLAGITKLHSIALSQYIPMVNTEQIVDVEVERVSQLKRILRIMCRNAITAEVNTQTLSSHTVNYYTGLQCNVFLKTSDPYCAWFYESQNIQKLNECLGAKTVLFQITSDMTPMDCFAAGWCIGNSSCQWKLCFYSDIRLSLDCMQMLHAGIRHSSSQQKRRVCDLYIGEGVMNSDKKTVNEIFDLLGSNFDVRNFSYSCYCGNHKRIKHGDQHKHLSSLIKTWKQLKEVEIIFVNYPRVCCVMQTIIEHTQTLQLEALLLKYCKLHNNVISVFEKMEYLKILDLSGSSFVRQSRVGRSTCEQLAEMLKTHKTLQFLRVYGCGLSQEDTTTLFQVFTSNKNATLQTLDVSDNSYSIKHLEEMLVSNTSLQHLETTVTLVDDPNPPNEMAHYWTVRHHQSSEGAEFNSIQGMVAYVENDNTVDSVCEKIVSALTRNSTLKHLVINTLFSEWLEETLSTCQDHGKVKDKIKITQSKNPIYY